MTEREETPDQTASRATSSARAPQARPAAEAAARAEPGGITPVRGRAHGSDTALAQDLLDLLFAHTPASVTVSAVNGVLVSVALAAVAQPQTALAWFLGLLLILLARLLLLRHYRANPKRHALGTWYRAFILGTALTGLTWGSSILLLPADSLTYQVFLGFVISGMVAGAIPSLSPCLGAYLAYMTGALVPFAGRMAQIGNELNYSFLALVAMFALFMTLAARRHNQVLIRSLNLSRANLDLVADLRREKAQVELLNRDLRHQISERNAAAIALVAAKEQAEQASQAKTQFVANMSHEIRTPLNGVLGMLELLVQSSLTAEQRTQVQTALGSGEGLLRLINDILDFAKIEAGKLEVERIPFAPRHLAAEVTELFRASAASRGIGLAWAVDARVPEHLLGDPHRLRQILVNLLGNALKFTARGQVRLTLQTLEEPGMPWRLSWRVTDSGIGMTAEQVARLFQPFVQADSSTTRRFGGSGLGLTISQQLAHLLGGEIQVESHAGVGSSFEVRLPCDSLSVRTADAAEPQQPSDAVASSALPGDASPLPAPAVQQADGLARLRGRILVAEDNVTNQKVLSGMLKRLGLEVGIANDGAEALAAVDATPYDLVLMDIQMPNLDGLTATRRLREREQAAGRVRLPVIALTASAMAGDREQCLAAGVDDYLAKPVRLQALQQALAPWLQPPDPLAASHPAATD